MYFSATGVSGVHPHHVTVPDAAGEAAAAPSPEPRLEQLVRKMAVVVTSAATAAIPLLRMLPSSISHFVVVPLFVEQLCRSSSSGPGGRREPCGSTRTVGSTDATRVLTVWPYLTFV